MEDQSSWAGAESSRVQPRMGLGGWKRDVIWGVRGFMGPKTIREGYSFSRQKQLLADRQSTFRGPVAFSYEASLQFGMLNTD